MNKESGKMETQPRYVTRLREVLDHAGVSAASVASQFGVTPRAMQYYVQGTFRVRDYLRPKMAAYFGVSEEFLLPPYTPVVRLSPTSTQGNAMNRQQFLHRVGCVVGATLLMPPVVLEPLDQEILTRFQRALKKPSTVDENFLCYLEKRTDTYWQDRHSAAIPSQELLGYVREHFQKILQLLEGSLLPPTRERFCSLASSTAQLIGELHKLADRVNKENTDLERDNEQKPSDVEIKQESPSVSVLDPRSD